MNDHLDNGPSAKGTSVRPSRAEGERVPPAPSPETGSAKDAPAAAAAPAPPHAGPGEHGKAVQVTAVTPASPGETSVAKVGGTGIREPDPAQILQAGRRAEAAGRPDYAVKFYQHLIDFHAGTDEGRAAREHLDRLSAAERKLERGGRSSLFPELDMLAASLPVREGPPQGREGSLAQLTLRRTAASPPAEEEEASAADAQTRSYPLGNLLARLLSVAGLLFVLGGIGLPLAVLTGGEPLAAALGGANVPLAVFLGVLAAGLGLNMLVSSLVARAVFSHARTEETGRRAGRPA